jgi:hypothetical protein
VWVIEPVGHKQVKAWAARQELIEGLRLVSVFIDGPLAVTIRRYFETRCWPMEPWQWPTSRLDAMLTTERRWVEEAHLDAISGGELYDFYVARYNEQNEAMVLRTLCNVATVSTANQ